MAASLETYTREEQCCVICFLSSEGVKLIEINRRMKTQYGDACLSLQVYEWGRKFKNGVSNVADADRPGRPHTAYTPETMEHVERVVRENRRVTADEVALELDISHGCAHHIMHDVLQYHKVCARWAPRVPLGMETGTASDVWIFTVHVPESQMKGIQNCLVGANRSRRRKSIRGAFSVRRKPLLGRVGMAYVLSEYGLVNLGRRGVVCVVCGTTLQNNLTYLAHTKMTSCTPG
jgi:hypothetical protein